MRVQQRDRFRTSGLAASRSWTEAAVITTAGTSPIVSTAMRRTWRERVGLAVVLAGAAAGYGGTAGGRSPEGGVRGSRRVVGLASEGRGESCRPQRRDSRGAPLYGESSWPLFPFGCSRPSSLLTAPDRQAGAPKVHP